jgi:uncharacterized membrane protein
MSTTRSDAQSLIDEYLDQVRRATAALPTGRDQLLADLETHIQTALGAEHRDEGQVESVRRVLADLGSPQQIASAAYEQAGITLPHRRTPGQKLYDVATIALLTIGGWVPLPFVGWLIGVGMLWVGSRWDRRDKFVGTLVSPAVVSAGYVLITRVTGQPSGGGFVTPMMLAVAAVSTLVTGIFLIVRARHYGGRFADSG